MRPLPYPLCVGVGVLGLLAFLVTRRSLLRRTNVVPSEAALDRRDFCYTPHGPPSVVAAFVVSIVRVVLEDDTRKHGCYVTRTSLSSMLQPAFFCRRAIFANFGALKLVDMSHDASTGRHKGFCFIEYVDEKAADAALRAMNGFELAGRAIKVCSGFIAEARSSWCSLSVLFLYLKVVLGPDRARRHTCGKNGLAAVAYDMLAVVVL